MMFWGVGFRLFLLSLASEGMGYPTNVRTRNEIDVSLFIPQLEQKGSKLAKVSDKYRCLVGIENTSNTTLGRNSIVCILNTGRANPYILIGHYLLKFSFPFSLTHVTFNNKTSPCPPEVKKLFYPLLKRFCSDVQGTHYTTAYDRHSYAHRIGIIRLGPR